MKPSEIVRQIRANAIARDDEGHFARELAFNVWREETVFPDAVNRLIREIGEASR